MKIEVVKVLNSTNNVFKGSGAGVFTTVYKNQVQKRNKKLKPEQIDGDITDSGIYGKAASQQTPSLQNSPDILQTICD